MYVFFCRGSRSSSGSGKVVSGMTVKPERESQLATPAQATHPGPLRIRIVSFGRAVAYPSLTRIWVRAAFVCPYSDLAIECEVFSKQLL